MLLKLRWTPRGEYFDYEASSDSASAKDIFDKITEAGMSYFCYQMGSYLPGAKVSKLDRDHHSRGYGRGNADIIQGPF